MPTTVPSPRLHRERATLRVMVALHCRDRHRAGPSPCAACQELLTFAELRLHRCPFQERKPTCANCPIHCYREDRRQQVRDVMRHSGPRMLLRHPLLALRHWLDGFRRAPMCRRGPGPN